MKNKIFLSLLFCAIWTTADAATFTLHGKMGKTTLADADVFGIEDSSASYAVKHVTAVNLKSYVLKDSLQPGTLTYTSNASPSAADLLANKYITNYGATGTIAVTLPAVSYEICRGVITSGASSTAQIIQVTPPTGEAFDLSGTTLTVNQSFAGPATVGAKAVVCRQRNAAGTWIWSADVVRGTWAGI